MPGLKPPEGNKCPGGYSRQYSNLATCIQNVVVCTQNRQGRVCTINQEVFAGKIISLV